MAHGTSVRIACFLNQAGTFDDAPRLSPGAGQQLEGTADFNLDGKADLFSETTVFLGRGDGTFQRVSPDLGPKAYTTGDFNEDGIPDLAGEWMMLGRGDGTFDFSPLPGPAKIAMDCNRDGHLDLITHASNSYEDIGIAFGLGNGQMTPAKNLAHEKFLESTGDLNGDGFCDVMGSNWVYPAELPATLTTYLGDSEGGLKVAARWQPISDYYYTGTLVDMDRDGKLDLVNDPGYGVEIDRGRGDGGFIGNIWMTDTWTISPIESADWNHDKRPDLVVLTYASSVSLLTQRSGDAVIVATSSANDAGAISPSGFATLKATNLASATAVGSVVNGKWPFQLAGVELHILDGAGRNSTTELLYVAPDQINFRIPDDVVDGWKTLQLVDASGIREVGKVLVQHGAPSIFQNAGAPVVEASQINPDGTLTPVPTIDCAASCRPLPLQGPIQLKYYLTGFAGTVNDTWVVIGNKRFRPQAAGSIPDVPGLESITVRIDGDLVDGRTLTVAEPLLFTRGQQIH
jgi:uncharacterized protein (TIGR03437 family)